MLTRERLRADIAGLLHEAPEAIGGEDALMDLGLDSLRAMTLLTRWAREGGLTLDFAEFAETLTLDAWWTIIARAQTSA